MTNEVFALHIDGQLYTGSHVKKVFLKKGHAKNSLNHNSWLKNEAEIVRYIPESDNHAERSYLRLLEKVLNEGYPKSPVRFDSNGKPVKLNTDTIGIPNVSITHDMSEGFPLLTTKYVPIRIVAVELEGFIKGITDKSWYQQRKCNIWNEWANPLEVENEFNFRMENNWMADPTPENISAGKKEVAKDCDDLGPIYGYQWRNFGQQYYFDNYGIQSWNSETEDLLGYPDLDKMDGVVKGYDQLKSIVDKLHTNPYDRRMYCSAWNPNQMHMMALPPCHLGWGVTVYDNKLHLNWTQRSCDAFLGIPFNIASYALLLLLLCHEAKLEPGLLTGNFIDFHIYNNHIDQCKEQISREPKDLPTVIMPNFKDIYSWEHDNMTLCDYDYHPAIKGDVTV